MNKKLIGAIIAVVIVLVGGYYYASPYLVLNSIKNAAQAGDSEKVSAYMDYPSVRQSFKDQMNAYMVKEMALKETNGWEALGTMIATTMVDKMVDAVVTPEGMTLMLQGKDFKDSLKAHTEQLSLLQKETMFFSSSFIVNSNKDDLFRTRRLHKINSINDKVNAVKIMLLSVLL
ncbi:DUF2939 domain-containing protein [Acinetobacter modestus]|uniref:DUF2939 domain-containing protein n=1 Tax=Acinetobacter modestus TaxID=1776740 RepID=UPI001F4A3E2A|nr:DUF2939 domain-containing protein [Acinetobacter modestus]MCH7388334.1 DUF2939 domain-containing protein [Acinetobacter modestus]